MQDNDDADFFDGPDLPDAPETPKEPELSPDDPAYWEREEGQWEHLKPRRAPRRIWLWLTGALLILAACIFLYLRYFSPYITDAVQYGYIDRMERRGTIFKTGEGTLIPYKELTDTTRVYKSDFQFSCSDAVFRRLSAFERNGQPVRLSYKQYHTTLPWRGDSRIIVTAVDSVNPAKILPPEYNPNKPINP